MSHGGPAPRRFSSEPLFALARIPIYDCGEPLVDFLDCCPALILDRPRYGYQRATLLRSGVAERLCRAVERLPEGCRLSVIEGWRDPEHQRLQYLETEDRLRREHPEWPESTLRRMVNRLSAPPDGPVPAPHTTGGAVDIWLCSPEGTPLDLSSPYRPNDTRSYRLGARGLTPEVVARRRILQEIMESAGFTNYAWEYWHWSYGDQGWAQRTGSPFAVYGQCGPASDCGR